MLGGTRDLDNLFPYYQRDDVVYPFSCKDHDVYLAQGERDIQALATRITWFSFSWDCSTLRTAMRAPTGLQENWISERLGKRRSRDPGQVLIISWHRVDIHRPRSVF